MEKIKINEENKAIILSLAGGCIGGIGHHEYNKAYNANNIQGTIVSDAFSGLIAGFIGLALVKIKFKKQFSNSQVLAIAMAIGLSFHGVFKLIKGLVNSQTRIYQLENAVAFEQKQTIANNKAIAATTKDEAVKKQAIENIAEISDRSEDKTEGIKAIAELVEDEDKEVKEAAIEKLSTIVDDSEDSETLEAATEAIQETVTDSDTDLVMRSLEELDQSIHQTSDQEKQRQLIHSIGDYYGNHGKNIDAWIVSLLESLQQQGINSYLSYDVNLKRLVKSDGN